MSTTSIFVELLIIGLSALCWLLLIIGALFGLDLSLYESFFKFNYAIPLIAFCYVLGIVSDRFADIVVDRVIGKSFPWNDKSKQDTYYKARRKIFKESARLTDQLEYGRSRLRICRGWAFNGFIIAICLPVYFLSTQFIDISLFELVIIEMLILLFSLACLYAWWKIAWSEYNRIVRVGCD